VPSRSASPPSPKAPQLPLRPINPEWRRVLTTEEALRQIPHLMPGHSQCVVVAGRKEMGKSYLVREWIEEGEPRVLCLDPQGDYPWIRRRLEIDDAVADLASGEPCRRRVVCPWQEDTREFGERFFRAIVEDVRDCLIVVDELTMFTDTTPTTMDRSFRKILFEGRKPGLRLVLASQRVVHFGEILSEVTELCLFKLVRPRDLETVAEWTDEIASQKVAELEPRHCLLLTF
jgi:hypothetical protein